MRTFNALCVVASVMASVMVSMVCACPGAAQDSNSTQDPQSFPTNVVIAGVPVPAHPLDWSHYTGPEYCEAAFKRVLWRIEETAPDKTGLSNDWVPLPPAAIAIGSQCLRHLVVAKLPALSLPRALRVAIALNADSLVPRIVAQQLALAPGNTARAALLDSAVEALMSNRWSPDDERDHLTADHVQLARSLVSQIDAFGAVAFTARIQARRVLMQPVQAAHQIDAELALQQELQQLFQHEVPASLSKADSLFVESGAIDNRGAITRLRYLKTLSDEDLRARIAFEYPRDYRGLLGTQAPPVSANYWFSDHQHSIQPESASAMPATPAPGRISILLFQEHGQGDRAHAAELHRLHEQFPDVDIITIVHTEGQVGPQILVNHPEQEVALLHQLMSDTLGYPGTVCVIVSPIDTVQGGHVVAQPSATDAAYRYNPAQAGGGEYIIDQRGIVVAEMVPGGNPYGDDLIDFIRRLHAKSASRF